jgi:hypothetical protein
MYELRKTLETINAKEKYMSSSTQTAIKVKLFGINSDTWPCLENLWDFYSKKGIKTVFFSIGATTTAAADLEIAETLGCPIHIWDSREKTGEDWEDVKTILKNRKREPTASAFTEKVETRWVLPKNIRFNKTMPAFTNGNITVENTLYPVSSWQSCVGTAAETMGLSSDQHRIDICKIALGQGLERSVIYSLMDSPFRPGLLLVEWTSMPDQDLHTTLCAGHLQNCGYSLLANKGNRFFYAYNDRCMYEICSWETNKVENPMVAELSKVLSLSK